MLCSGFRVATMSEVGGIHVHFHGLFDKFHFIVGVQFLKKWGIDSQQQKLIQTLVCQTQPGVLEMSFDCREPLLNCAAREDHAQTQLYYEEEMGVFIVIT